MTENPPLARHPPTEIDGTRLDMVRECLDRATDKPAVDALPYLRRAVDELTTLLDETMAIAILAGQASLRSAAHQVGLTENAIGPRLARTRVLGAYADTRGRVTATGVQQAKYDYESGTPKPTSDAAPMRFKPRRPTN